MITEQATVLRVADGFAWVSTNAQAGCQRCAEGKGCGGDVMGRLLGDRLREVRVEAGHLELRRGDEVTIGITETALLGASVIMYLVPLLTMLCGAVLTTVLFPDSGEPGAILGAGAGLVAGLAGARRFGRRRGVQGGYAPRVIGKIAAADRAEAPAGIGG